MVSLFYNNSAATAIAWIFGCTGILTNTYVFISTLIYTKRPNINVINISSDTGNRWTHPRRPNRSIGSQTFMTLIGNLAVSDFLGSIYLLLLASTDLHYRLITRYSKNSSTTSINSTVLYLGWVNSAGCYIARFLHIVSVYQSIHVTLFIAIDRYLNVTNIYSNKMKLASFGTKIAVGIGWLIGCFSGTIFNIYYYAAPIWPNENIFPLP